MANQTRAATCLGTNSSHTEKTVSLRNRIDRVIAAHGNMRTNGDISASEAMRSLSDDIIDAVQDYQRETEESARLEEEGVQRSFQVVSGFSAKYGGCTEKNPDALAKFERGLHERMMEVERGLLGDELATYDVDAEAIE